MKTKKRRIIYIQYKGRQGKTKNSTKTNKSKHEEEEEEEDKVEEMTSKHLRKQKYLIPKQKTNKQSNKICFENVKASREKH